MDVGSSCWEADCSVVGHAAGGQHCCARVSSLSHTTLPSEELKTSRLCALLMYMMWWNKPLLPNEPVVLRGEWVLPLCAYMYLSSEMSGRVEHKSVRAETSVKSFFAALELCSKSPELEKLCLQINGVEQRSCDPKPQSARFRLSSKQSMDRVGEENLKKRALDTAFFERRPRLISSHFEKPELISPTTQRRWDLAARAVELYPVLSELYIGFVHDEGRCVHLAPTELLACRIQN